MKPFCAADILLPDESINLEKWAALACDQFTSRPEYWQQAEEMCRDVPGALHITLPEAYLGAPDEAARIEAIHRTMNEYLDRVLTRAVHGFVYVERTTESGVRQGLVGAVDLEAYDYRPGAQPPVRPSENTVAERIPPRLAVRRGAALETPHILMLIDDAQRTVVEPLGARKNRLRKLYDTPLMLGGGRVAGWAVTDPADIAAVENALEALGTQAAFDPKYPEAAGRAPLAMAVGDGNHSLATAKAAWEEVKAGLTEAEKETHPARWCLVELENIHCPAIRVEPIHRAVFGTSFGVFADAFRAWLQAHGGASENDGAPQTFGLTDGEKTLTLGAANPPRPLAVGTLEAFLADFGRENPGARVDYIHGRDEVRRLAQQGAVGVLLPDFQKSDLFRGVVLGGVLPKKTFSMGHAQEKRYYLECRKIL